jgi:hypothetical protein
MAAADSAAITRFARGADHGDTVAWVRLDKEAVQIRNMPGGAKPARRPAVIAA